VTFPPEFAGTVDGWWMVYSPFVFFLLAIMFAVVVVFAFGYVTWSILRRFF